MDWNVQAKVRVSLHVKPLCGGKGMALKPEAHP